MKKTNKKLDRRDFLKSTSAVALGLSFPYPLRTLGATQPAALEDLPILVVLYLRGGMDALNAIIPYKDSRYYAIRPTISIRRKTPGPTIRSPARPSSTPASMARP